MKTPPSKKGKPRQLVAGSALRLWHVVVIVAILGFLWGALALIADPDTTFWVVNIGVISIGVGLLVAYSNAVIDAWVHRKTGLRAGHLLSMGITVNWIGIILRQAGWYFSGDTPPDLLQLWVLALTLSFSGGVLHIAAVESIDAAWAPRYFIISAGVATALTVIALSAGLFL